MAVLALVLILLSVALTLPLVLSARGYGPEGPVGAPMVTIPLALLAAVGFAILAWRGLWAFFPHARLLAASLLPGYLMLMTVFPILAVPRRKGHGLVRAACLLIFAAGVVGGALGVMDAPPAALRAASGIVLGLAGLGGWGVVAMMAVGAAANAARQAEADAQRMGQFEREQSAFQAAEWAKLPPNPELWQVIHFVYGVNPEVQAACRASIAARPALEAEMIALLGTGWAKHGADYIADFYAPPPAPLAPAYAGYLMKALKEWETTLLHHPDPGIWEGNLRGTLGAAVKIAQAGGDLRAPLEAWVGLLSKVRGLDPLAARLRDALRPR